MSPQRPTRLTQRPTRSIASSPAARSLEREDRRPLQISRIRATIGDMPGPVTDVRAGVVRRRYQQQFGGAELPVPVGAIAEDLCGFTVEEFDNLVVSGMRVPCERRIYTFAAEHPARRRCTLAHELGHWICQCLEGKHAHLYC